MKAPSQPTKRLCRTKHEYTGLWFHFGQYGRQDVHVHSCFACWDGALIGIGHDCGGSKTRHWQENLAKPSGRLAINRRWRAVVTEGVAELVEVAA